MPTPKNAPPPPVRAARNIVAEVRAGARFQAPLLTESPHCGTRAPQVVHTAHAALDDVCKLYSVDPRSNPAVSTQRPPNAEQALCADQHQNTRTARFQVTAATHKRLSGRAASRLHAARTRLRQLSAMVNHLSHSPLPATQSTDKQRPRALSSSLSWATSTDKTTWTTCLWHARARPAPQR
jgi:N-formylglutamate amidohydrolase